MTGENSTIAAIRMETPIAASPASVWEALTSNIGQWWPAEFYAGGDPDSRSFSLDARPGGHMMETWRDGGGVLWGVVVAVEPRVRLQVLGSTFPNWGGPSQWFGTWELAAAGEQTVLTFSEHAIGKNSASGTAEKDKGWQFLWQTLRAHAEGKTAPSWVD